MATSREKNGAQTTLIAGASAVAILVVAGAVGLGVRPILSERSERIETTEVVRAENADLATRVSDLTTKAEGLDAKRQEARTFAASFPGDADQDALVESIQAAASQAGVAVTGLTSVTPTTGSGVLAPDGTPSEATSIAVVPLDLSVTGTFESITAFIRNVEGLPRTVVVDSVALARDETGPESATASVDARAFLARTLVDPADEVATAPEETQ